MVVVNAPLFTVAFPISVFPVFMLTVPSGTFLPYLSLTVPVTITFPAVLFNTLPVVVVGILPITGFNVVLLGLYVPFPG